MYCKNCGFKTKDEDKFCTNCGFYKYNSPQNNHQHDNDKASIILIIICILFPIVGLILYLVLKATEQKKAKTYVKSSLISLCIRFILIIIMVIGAFLTYSYVAEEIGESWTEIVKDTHYEYNEHPYNKENINYFSHTIDNYVNLATGNFYKEIYQDNKITEKCYNIDDLEENSIYDGSIEIRLVDNKEKITIWFTDSEYYVEAIDYSTFTINNIKKGNKLEHSCNFDKYNNSL